ncbi:hypothetical protein AMJ86_10200 [bacterium SM23_57]|nr:MAG: hypothetical protein AMJ86_10200 [bacterium SM23_57]
MSSLEVKGLKAVHLNWISISPPDQPFEATIQVRYRDRGVPGMVFPNGEHIYVQFNDTHRGIAPGQSVVFYDGDCLLGGGLIDSAIEGDLFAEGVNKQDISFTEEA